MSTLIKINDFNLITSWSHIMDKNTDCTICRQHLNCDSIYAIEKGEKSTISKGNCGHMFHKECISPWLLSNKKCPICSFVFN
jgi:RING-box protein 1